MIDYIDQHREAYWVEPICRVLPIAPATYYVHSARKRNPELRPAREKCDEQMSIAIERVYAECHDGTYGADKIWHQLRREGTTVARCAVERLMRKMGLRGVVRGRAFTITTTPDTSATRPPDLVKRSFAATRPHQLSVADITYVATWIGFVYVAFVIVFSRAIVGWRVSSSLRSDLALDALEQALHARPHDERLVHHSDRGVQYLSVCYTERLAAADIECSVGSVGDSYDNALAETINGLFKTELIRRKGPRRTLEEVEFATLKWVYWFNHKRLLEPLGCRPPMDFEKMYYDKQRGDAAAA